MALTNTQIGAIVASCAATFLITAITILFFTNTLNRLQFLHRRRKNPSNINCPHYQPLYQPDQLRRIRNREELDVEAQRLSPCSTSRPSISSDFETYGNLIIPLDRRPVPTAFDIVNRVLMVTGLSAGTTVNPKAASEQVGVVVVEANADGESLRYHDGSATRISGQKREARDFCLYGTIMEPRGFGTGRGMAALYHAV